MQFSSPLTSGTLIKRYKRFLADIELQDGSVITAHCPNTGAMTGCAEPGMQVWLSKSENPKRKYAYTWELAVNNQQHWICINTHNANKVFAEAFAQSKVLELNAYKEIHPEIRYGEQNSRIDFLLKAINQVDCYVEVKSVTLLREGIGQFPDAVTTRGQKHLQELMHMQQTGVNTVLCFVAQHTGIQQVSAAEDIDPGYAKLLTEALDKGVKVLAYGCHIDQEKVELNQALPVQI